MAEGPFPRAYPPGRSLTVASDLRGQAIVFVCRGDLTLGTAPQMDRLIAEARAFPGQTVVLDLLEIRHADSTGVGTLAVLLRHAMSSGRRLVLVASPPVRKILEGSCLDRAFQFADTVAAALAETA